MRVMELDRSDTTKLPTKVLVELLPQADGSVRATWHDEGFREYIEESRRRCWPTTGSWSG